MTNRIWEARQQRQAANSLGPQLTELGDPNWSPSWGSQQQVPGAAAQSRQFDNMRRAQGQIDEAVLMGYDVSDPAWEPVHEQAETGFIPEQRGAIGTLVGWIDGPRQATNLLMQDIFGGPAQEGFENPNFGDYMDALWGGVNNSEGFEERTGLNPESGSQTLDLMGWAEADEDDILGRVTRGIADFGLQVATDPLTYVTFGLSGLGKKVALQAGRSMQQQVTRRVLQAAKHGKFLGEPLTAYEKNLLANLDEIVGSFQDRLVAKAGKFGGELPPEMKSALDRYFGRSEDVWENITEAALANRISDDVIRPLVGRDFAAIDSLAMEHLPAYAKGGARISVPFTKNTLTHGYVIPGSQGLGRKLVGDPMRALHENLRKLGPYGKLADAVRKGTNKMDQMAPILRAVRNGDIEGWQFHIAASAIDNMHNNVARHTISTELNSQWNRISELAGNTDEDLSIIGADILMRLEGSNMSDITLQQIGRSELTEGELAYRMANPQLASAVDETITYMQEVMGSYHEALSALDPEFASKFIDGYIPHSPTKEARQIITALSQSAAGDSGKGDTAMDLMAQILNAAGHGGKAEQNMGTVRHVNRTVGRLSAVQLTDDGSILLDKNALLSLGDTQPLVDVGTGVVDPETIARRYISTPQLNELLEPIVRRLAAENGVPLAKSWDGKLFNENPIDTMIDYVDNMTDAVNAWQTMESLTASGLAFRHQTELDVQQVIQNMMNNAVRNTSIIETTKFGKPTVGETDEAPVSWLEQVVDPDDYTGAGDDIAGRVRADADELEGSRNYEGFVDDIAQNGVREPVRLTITADGQVQVIDGHHRIAAAREAGLTTVPVKVVRENAESGLDIRNGVNVKQHMAPGWHTGGKPAHSLYEDIRDNPQNYVFHATSRKNIGLIEQQGWRRGSVVPERAHAETYAAQHAEELGGDTAFIQIYRVEDLPSSVRGPIERGEPISTQIDELPPMPEASRIKPVAQYQVGEGFDAALGPQFVDDVKAYDMHEAFDTLPWQPEVVKELNLLHGGPNQSRIAGVSREVLDSVDDSKVIRWSQLEDVADTRKVAQKVNSSHYTDWAEEVPTPHYEQSSPIEARNYEWETHVDSNSIRHEAFKPEQLDEAGAARQKVMREKEKARKATRAKDRKALSKGEEIPRLRVSSRKHSHPQGAVLRFMPYENLTAKERQNVWRAAHEWLDRAFQEKGVFDGQFTDQGIQDIINSGLDDYTAEVLHSYVHTKLGSLGRDAIEYIAKEPAEVFETRKLFDDWVRGMNQFIHANAAVRTSDGKLIADPDKIAIAGGPEVREELARLKRAALKLGSRGYDEAVAVMQDVEAYTGVQSLKGYVNPEAFNLGGPAIKDMTVEMNVAEWLSLTAKNMGTIYTPEGVAAAKLAANETLKWWRAMATLPRPAFHIRNLVGGSWMNMNFGVKSKTMAKASRYGLAFRKALGEATGPEGIEQAFERLPKEMRNAWRAAWDHNVLAGFATTEFSNAVTPRGARARWDWAKAWDIDNFALTRAGGKVMESVEDFLRMSLFLEYYDEAIPGSAKTAADIVNAVHFDYSNLTPTETKLKSIIPFFVWTRRNLPLQIQTAVENPRYVQRYRAMLQSMNDNLGGDDPENLQEADYYSAYAAGTSYKVNPNTPFWARVMIDPDLPISDLLSIPNPEPGALVEYANNVLGPHISLISDLNGQREFGNVNAPAPFNTVLQGLAAVGMYDRTLDGDVRIPYYMRTLLETAVPLSREIADPITGGPTDPSRQQRYGITPDDNFAEAGAKSLAAQLAGGFGIKLTTPADARAKAFRSDAELDQIIRELQLGGQAPPVQP